MADHEVPDYVLSFAFAVEQRARRASQDGDARLGDFASDAYTAALEVLAPLARLRLPVPTCQPITYTHHDEEFICFVASFAVNLDQLACHALDAGRSELAAVARCASDAAYVLMDIVCERLPLPACRR